MTPRIGVGLCFFQDYEGVERLLSTIPEEWKLIAVDGKYPQYHDDHSSLVSDDKVRDLIKQRPNSILLEASWAEWLKRNVYLYDYGLDFLLVVDSDEYLMFGSDVAAFYKELETIPVDIPGAMYIQCHDRRFDNVVIKGRLPISRPRLFIQPDKLSYHNKHHYQVTYNKEIVVPTQTVYSLKIFHDPFFRDPMVQEKHDNYIKYLEAFETDCITRETEKEKYDRELSSSLGY